MAFHEATNQLITLVEAERLTGRKVCTWRKDLRERRFPYVQIGRQVRVRLSDVQAMIEGGFHPAITSINDR